MPVLLSKRVAISLWLLGLAAIALLAVLRWPQEDWLKTDFTALLPSGSSNPWQLQANTAAAAAYESQLLVLVSGDSIDGVSEFIQVVDDTLRADDYVSARLEDVEQRKWRALSERLYPYRWNLLSRTDRQALQLDPVASLEGFRRLLYSPLGGSMAGALASDPAGLYRNFLEAGIPTQGLVANTDFTRGNVQELALYAVRELGPGESLGAGLYTAYLSLREQAAARGLSLHATGVPLYSSFGVLSAEREISTIGLVSLLVLIIALIVVLRSLSAIVLTLVCVFSGVFAGWVSTVVMLQQIHILTLVFGVTIIGIAADYAFHYLAHTALAANGRNTLDIVFTGLATGTATSVLAFVGLTILPFPGIRQIGIFMATGLLASFLTVCLLFPHLYRSAMTGLRLPGFCSRPRFTRAKSWRILLFVTVTALPGLFLLESRSDVRDFYAAPDNLQNDQQVIQQLLGGTADSRYLLIRAGDSESLLQSEEQLREALWPGLGAGNGVALGGVSSIIPSASKQRDNRSILRMLADSGNLQSHMQALGFNNTAQQEILADVSADFQPLELAALDGLQLPVGLGGFLGCVALECASWMPLPAEGFTPALGKVLSMGKGVMLVDPVADINQLLAGYRSAVLVVLGTGSGLIALLLTLLWGYRRAVEIITLPVLSCVFSLAVTGYITGHYSIVNLLALLLIIGVGLDYAIFRVFSRPEDQPATSLAISLSALTSVLAFGMLGFSDTPLIASFGQTIVFGLLPAYLLSWCRFGARV